MVHSGSTKDPPSTSYGVVPTIRTSLLPPWWISTLKVEQSPSYLFDIWISGYFDISHGPCTARTNCMTRVHPIVADPAGQSQMPRRTTRTAVTSGACRDFFFAAAFYPTTPRLFITDLYREQSTQHGVLYTANSFTVASSLTPYSDNDLQFPSMRGMTIIIRRYLL